MVPVVVVLWEGANWTGRKRQFVEDTPNLILHAFNDNANAIGIHPGPDYDSWKAANGGQEPVVVFYQDIDYEGRGLAIRGGLPVLNDPALAFRFDGIISSIRINPPILRTDGQVDIDFPGIVGGLTPTLDAPIRPIRHIVVLFANPAFQGNRYVIVESQADIATILGTDLNGASSALVIGGPDYDGSSVSFYDQVGFAGNDLFLDVGSYSDLGQYGWAGRIQSIQV